MKNKKNLYKSPDSDYPYLKILSKTEGTESSTRLPSDCSPTNLSLKGSLERDISLLSMDYQLTVRPKVELTRYQISMLLSILCFDIVWNGINFNSWLALEYLSSRLLGSKKIYQIRNKYERKSLTCAEFILLTTDNSWLSLEEKTFIQPEMAKYLIETSLLISKRTWISRIEYWQPVKFIEVRAVRLDVFLEKEKNSTPYSSYTKGYGESSRMGRRLKTRPSAELDGEDEDKPEEVILEEISQLIYLDYLKITKEFKSRKA